MIVPQITYVENSGKTHVISVETGMSVMEGARRNNIEGILADCGGVCACATCHVYIDGEWIARLPKKSEIESEMLAFAIDPDPQSSRLACRLVVTDELNGLVVRMPRAQG